MAEPARDDGTWVAPEPSGKSWDLAGMERLSTSAVAGKVLAAMGEEDPDIVVLTADLKFSNQTVDFERAHPERFVNVGISEQHMVSMAAGMASVGLKPYVATFAPFVGLLAGEHIRTDLAYPGLPVRVIAHHAGIAIGFYGTSHHATEDLGLMRSIAGLTVVCPCDATATEAALRQSADLPGPVYFRVGRGRDVDVYDTRPPGTWCLGEAAVLREGGDLTIVANGITVAAALQAARALAAEGVEATVIDAHTVRPFDGATIAAHAGRSGRLLVAEEHNVVGGVASACAEALVEHGLAGVRMARIGMPADEYSLIGPPTHLYRHYGMDADGIEAKARELLAD
ncbi:MAG TPA: transketolase C-terminal domain-containing protein [Solirubrobacterales bacterium]|nr:transketolase C-terminal domain-containing protein [Solirubrobacterales bacterium]